MTKTRLNIKIQGTVQGLGFRPFVYRLANEMGINGFVQNSTSGVSIEAEGDTLILNDFIIRLRAEKPDLATFTNFDYHFLDTVGYDDFYIKESSQADSINALILPDIAVCSDCLKEMNNPNDRRYQYPFINCTHCGPRFSIIESLPYDRPNTSMKSFEMCPDCRKEYENPGDRRYHAQPIACPVCGPHVELWDSNGTAISKYNKAITDACDLILKGNILALKGIGGFQLIADARNSDAIRKLRAKKHREEKPLALMCIDYETAYLFCEIHDLEKNLLNSNESPIVLLKKRKNPQIIISPEVAPDNPYLGVMFPYSPLHHLLIHHLQIPIVATSGNLSEEPMCIDEYDALNRLGNIADYFLVHNRPIVRHVDDSIARIISGRASILRRARGYAPLPLNMELPLASNAIVLATGAHLKNSIALKKDENIFISQHIGDMTTNEANKAFTDVIKDFKAMYHAEPVCVVCDLHPDYLSTKYAKSISNDVLQVQHHIAHVLSCRLENSVTGNALGVAWDGTGYGFDATVWGGEFFLSGDDSCRHIAQFKQFMLPGGEIAIKEPRRSAVGMLYNILGDSLFSNENNYLLQYFLSKEKSLLQKMLSKKINCPLTSSVGRIFDAVSSLLNLKQVSAFEGQAAMAVEFIADNKESASYNFNILEQNILIIDWETMLKDILSDITGNIPKANISAKFHNTLADIIITLAEHLNMKQVILSGGCFQNVLLTEKVIKRLLEKDFEPYWNQMVPTNDGGIALGQIGYYLMQDADSPMFLNENYLSNK